MTFDGQVMEASVNISAKPLRGVKDLFGFFWFCESNLKWLHWCHRNSEMLLPIGIHQASQRPFQFPVLDRVVSEETQLRMALGGWFSFDVPCVRFLFFLMSHLWVSYTLLNLLVKLLQHSTQCPLLAREKLGGIPESLFLKHLTQGLALLLGFLSHSHHWFEILRQS